MLHRLRDISQSLPTFALQDEDAGTSSGEEETKGEDFNLVRALSGLEVPSSGQLLRRISEKLPTFALQDEDADTSSGEEENNGEKLVRVLSGLSVPSFSPLLELVQESLHDVCQTQFEVCCVTKGCNSHGLHQCFHCAQNFCACHSEALCLREAQGLLPNCNVQPYACQDCAPRFQLLVERELTLQRLQRLAHAQELRMASTSLSMAARSTPPESSRQCVECGDTGKDYCEVCGLCLCRDHCLLLPRTAGHNAYQCTKACGRCREHAVARAAAHTAVRNVVASAFRSSLSSLALARAVPVLEKAEDCAACGFTFAWAKRPGELQCHCGVCGLSLCKSCLCGVDGGCSMSCPHLSQLPARNGGHDSTVCTRCLHITQKRVEAESIVKGICAQAMTNAGRCSRVLAFIEDQNQLPLYEQDYVDTAKNRAMRASDFAIQGVVGACPLLAPAWLSYTSQAVNVLWQHGRYVLFGLISGNEYSHAFETLKSLAATLPSIKAHELVMGSLYLSAEHRMMLRDAPRGASDDVQANGGKCVPIKLLESALSLASLGMNAPYECQAFEAQRLALQQHWRLVDERLATGVLRAEKIGSSWKPEIAWCLFMHREQKVAVLAVRGTDLQTSDGSEFLMNVDALPVRVQGADGTSLLAHRGMLAAARLLEMELRCSLQALVHSGHQLVITGHSLGAAVAALVVWLLRHGTKGEKLPTGANCRGVGYAVPAIMDLASAVALQRDFTSVVNSHDVIPRLTTGALARLSSEITACAKESSSDFDTDLQAYLERLLTGWEPRLRSGVPNLPSSAGNGKPSTQMTLQSQRCDNVPEGVETRASSSSTQHHSRQTNKMCAQGQAQVEDFFVPGNIIWMHRVDGHMEAAIVPNDFPPLRRIVLDKRMITDHSVVAIHEALLSVHAGRAAKPSTAAVAVAAAPGPACEQQMQWQPFSTAGQQCPCCSSSYEWKSTSRSSKQRCHSMTNCRMCGLVVCVGCATTRRSLPTLPYLAPARVCDRCAFRVPGVAVGGGCDLKGLEAVGEDFAEAPMQCIK